MDVVRVRDVVLVGDALDDAEALLQALRELVGRRFERRAVERVVDVLGGFPLRRVLVQLLHDFEAERLAFRLRELLAVEGKHRLPEAGIAERNRRVAAVQVLVDRCPLRKTREGPVLPEDRRGV